jgi:hypothetical protein
MNSEHGNDHPLKNNNRALSSTSPEDRGKAHRRLILFVAIAACLALSVAALPGAAAAAAKPEQKAAAVKPSAEKKQAVSAGSAEMKTGKQAAPGAKNVAAEKEESKAKEALRHQEQKGKKKMLLGFNLGYFMPLEDLAELVDGQVSGRVFFQYQDIAWWFGLGVDVGFIQLDDSRYDGNIRFLNCILHPLLTFPLGRGFDLQILAGAGMAVVMASMEERRNMMNKTTVDPLVDAGVNIMYSFMGRFTVGIEGKYYHIFENTDYNGGAVSGFFGGRF